MMRVLNSYVLAIGLLAVGGQNAFADTWTFMKVPGIQGGSQFDEHLNEIDIVSLRQTFTALGRSGACSLEVVKPLDVAGPKLWAAAVTGQVFPEIEIEVAKDGGGFLVTFYRITLTNARVLSITTSGTDAFLETVTIGADSAKLEITKFKPDGTPAGFVASTVSCK